MLPYPSEELSCQLGYLYRTTTGYVEAPESFCSEEIVSSAVLRLDGIVVISAIGLVSSGCS